MSFIFNYKKCSFIVFSIFFIGFNSAILASETALTILHTNDWQSRLLGFGPNADFSPTSINDDDTVGGISRLATLIEQRRQQLGSDNVLLLDGGDYSMGTLFHTIIRETGSELQLLSMLGYDAITFGNHEFDYAPNGLASSIRAAMKVTKLPAIVVSNMLFDEHDSRDDSLQELWDEGIIRPWVIITKGKQRIGIFGLMGADAADVISNGKPLKFSDPIESASKMVAILQNEQVDLIVALSHGGVLKDEQPDSKWHGDDIDLLTAVDGIDVVVGGHSHTPLHEPIFIDNRVIIQAGSEAQFLGELSLSKKSQVRRITRYQLHPIDDSTVGSDEVIHKIERFKEQVTKQILQSSGYSFDQILTQSHRFLSRKYDDHVIANLVTDSLRKVTNSDIALTANGSIRDDIYLGINGLQRVSDIFRVVPLGVGVTSNEPGHEVIKLWLTGGDLKNIIEVLLLGYQRRGQSYYPRFSGFQVTYNTARMPFDQISQIKLGNSEDGYHEIDLSADNQHLYSMALNTYVASFLPLIEKISHGLLSITPKTVDGKTIHNVKDAIFDSDTEQAGVQEIKEWRAFFNYLENLSDINGDGISDLPKATEVRLIATNNYRLTNLFNNATWIMYTGTFIVLLLLSFLIWLVTKLFRQIQTRLDN